jgi:hypothetical protein
VRPTSNNHHNDDEDDDNNKLKFPAAGPTAMFSAPTHAQALCRAKQTSHVIKLQRHRELEQMPLEGGSHTDEN